MLKGKQVIIAILLLVGWAGNASGQDVKRGQLLYENHCQKCHDTRVHTREDRRTKNLVDISKWVIRWQYHLQLDWTFQEVRDVVFFLNQSYYHFAATP